MSDELERLACSLSVGDESARTRLEELCAPRKPGCPFAAELIVLAQGKSDPAAAGRHRRHLRKCSDCRASFQAFRRALERIDEADAEVEPVRPAPPVLAADREWASAVDRVADLAARGASAEELLRQTGLEPRAALRALLETLGRTAVAQAPVREAVPAATGDGEQPSLLDLLQARSGRLRNVSVRESRDPALGEGAHSWDERIRYFGCEVASLLLSLLAQATLVGVAWGRTVSFAISGVKRACETRPSRPGGPLNCVATLGGLVGELKVRAESSSSILASRLAEAINGNWEYLYTLHGMEAFISPFLGTRNELEITRRRIACFPNYQAIFGGPGQPGVIDQLDAIITSCGNAHHFNQFWTTELPRLGVTPEKINELTYCNVGGFLLERENLAARDRALLNDITHRWTGITRRHYEQCAQKRPGVILLALGHNKADSVLKCVELGLVTELIIDEDLAMALWDKIDPQKLYPRTLEAVLCRQVPT